jgi:molybdate transport system ATP-binding protein
MIDVHLQKRLPGFELDVTFASEAPVVVIHGPSGAGKSITLRMIAGLAKPDVGRITVAKRTFLDTDEKVCLSARERNVGYVFQDFALFPHLNVEKNIGFGLKRGILGGVNKSGLERVASLLETFELTEQRSRNVADLSGGQKQRVALARALAPKPDLLLLDEPFAALDETLRRSLRSELRRVQKTVGTPIVMVTHDVADVEALADDVVVVNRGKVERVWSLRNICRRRKVARFVNSHGPLNNCGGK